MKSQPRSPQEAVFGSEAAAEDGSCEVGPAASQDVVNSFIVLYGITFTMLGVVIPVCDALASDTLKHQTYDQAFYLYMHTTGLAFLAFISFVMYRFRDDKQQQKQQQLQPIKATSSAVNGTAVVDFDDDDNGVCDVRETNAGIAELSSPSANVASSRAGLNVGAAVRSMITRLRRQLSRQLAAAELRRRRQSERRWQRQTPAVWMSSEGINLYMRLGVIIFGFGVIIHDAFKLADTIEQPAAVMAGSHCRSNLWQVQLLVHLLFILLQTFHLFKSHRVVVSVYPSAVKFALAHLIVTNLCIWMKAVIYEVKMALTKNLLDNTTGGLGLNGTLANASIDKECAMALALDAAPSHSLSPFLYPCAVEYGLISAAICFKLFKKVGAEYAAEACRYDLPRPVRSQKFFTTCHKSHKGLFFGLLIVILIVVPLATLVLLPQRDQQKRDTYTIAVLAAECGVLLVTMAMCSIGAFKSIRSLTLTSRDVHLLDVNLLFVGLAGLLCYNLFVVVSSASCLMDEHHDEQETDHCLFGSGRRAVITKLNGLKSFLDGGQALSQAFLIAALVRRKLSRRLFLQGRKPARGILIALLVANLAMWMAAVFESKRHISVEFHENYFGTKAWKIIKYTTLPMIIFFRFHSTVCLSEIWKNTYCHKAQPSHSTSGS